MDNHKHLTWREVNKHHKRGRSRFSQRVKYPKSWDREGRAARLTRTAPNQGMQATPNSLRSCVAPAIGRA